MTKKAVIAQPPMEPMPSGAEPASEAHVAVVDIGSNSVRLVVYERLARAPFPRFNEKALCRLGDGLQETGEIKQSAFDHLVDTLARFRAITDAMGVERVDVLATEAIRKATNGDALVAAIKTQSGFDVRILSGEEEARYAGLGVVSGFYRPTGMVGDMGGGSMEVIEVVDDRLGDRHVSLPLGALPVQALLDVDPKEAKRKVDDVMQDALPPMLTTNPTFYAVGGGWRAVAKAHIAKTRAPVGVVHGYAIEARELRDFAKGLWRLSADELQAMPGVPSRRASTLAAAALVLDRLLKRLKPDRVVISALGLREGWLFSQLEEEQRTLDPLIEGAKDLGGLTARVPGFAAALLRFTEDLFPGETPQDRRLRTAICALTDVAWRDHPDVRAQEGFRRLLQFPFIGIEHAERAFLAMAIHARYGGGVSDPTTDDVLALLSSSQQRRALVLGRVLLLGHRVSASVPALLDACRLTIEADVVRLTVGEAGRVPDGDAVNSRLTLVAKAVGVPRVKIEVACPLPKNYGAKD